MASPGLPPDWHDVLRSEISGETFQSLQDFVARERAAHEVFPPPSEVYAAFDATPFAAVKVVILGQDPYHGAHQAHGLSFSVRPGIKPPPSLHNIFKELHADLGGDIPDNGYLLPWAHQGVLLLNAVLTVRAHTPLSHAGHGWEFLTDGVIRALNARTEPVVFVLWGAYAQKKLKILDPQRHTVVTGAHPSPLSARLFFGSKPFSRINTALRSHGQTPIHWPLPKL